LGGDDNVSKDVIMGCGVVAEPPITILEVIAGSALSLDSRLVPGCPTTTWAKASIDVGAFVRRLGGLACGIFAGLKASG
jgi:hypothetical protein